MNSCIAVVSDMIFATRISGTAQQLGAACNVVKNLDDLNAALESRPPQTVLVDMECEGLSPADAIRVVKATCADARVIAFFPHPQTDLMDQAKAAGADETIPRSAFVQRLPDLLKGV